MQAFWHVWVSLEIIVLQNQSLFVECALNEASFRVCVVKLDVGGLFTYYEGLQ
jgi:hypothetical protein